MNKLAIVMLSVMASACARQPIALPPPPVTTEVVSQNIPVPVLCKVELDQARIKLDSMETGKPLEEQNAAFRETIAQQKSYIVALEAGIIGCGGTIRK